MDAVCGGGRDPDFQRRFIAGCGAEVSVAADPGDAAVRRGLGVRRHAANSRRQARRAAWHHHCHRQPAAGGRRNRRDGRADVAYRWLLARHTLKFDGDSTSLLKSLPYDPVKDFMPISGISTFANIIAANANSNYRTLGDMLAAAKAKPGVLNVGTTTVGSTNHLAATLLQSMTGLKFVIVPFRTPGDLLTAVLRNDVDVIIQSYGALKSAVESKQIRALATTTRHRTAYAPDVPTVDESGVKGFDVVTWNGFFAPAKTAPEVIDTLNREVRAVLADPELKQRYLELGLEPLPTTPEQLGGRLRNEIEKWARVIADAGIEKQ